jgi:hypothetical protein
MARGITQSQVNNAADALLQRGIRPTIEKLRAELGTGSPNTLTRMVEAWWKGLAERLAAQARADLPGLPEAVQRAMQTVWSEATVAARATADARVLDREQQAHAKTQDGEARLAEMATLLETAQRSREAAEEALAAERQRAAELQSALSDALQSLKDTQGLRDVVRRSSEEERARQRADLERAVAAQDRWLRELDRAREDAKAAARETRSLKSELSREKAQRQRLAEELVSEKRDAKARIAALERQLSSQRRASAQAKTTRRPQTPTHSRRATAND